MAEKAILVNLERCVGCWSCSMACKVGNSLPDEMWWQVVRTLGSGEGIDRPAGKWPNLTMSWMPVYTKKCSLCDKRTSEGCTPYCVYNCPTKALTYGDLDDANSEISKNREALREKGYRIFSLPAWEDSKKEIVYASKD